jgi:zinc transporter ZupT
MNLLPYTALFLSAIFGSLIGVYLDSKRSKQSLTMILPFSGAFLLGVAVLHMLPEVFRYAELGHGIGVYILAGFFLQNVLEFLSRGVEHGHIHAKKEHNRLYIFSIMFGLCAHAFIEGLPVAYMSSENHGHAHDIITRPYLWGIVAHKVPAAIALSILLLASNVKKITLFILILIFAVMSPLGTLVSELSVFSAQSRSIILALSIGFILHIATTIIFETDVNMHHKISYRKLIAVSLGFGFAFISLL